MEIELLRKQRLMIEEERRLLMATKKLELVRVSESFTFIPNL